MPRVNQKTAKAVFWFVLGVGLGPTWPCGHNILSVACIPFHHPSVLFSRQSLNQKTVSGVGRGNFLLPVKSCTLSLFTHPSIPNFRLFLRIFPVLVLLHSPQGCPSERIKHTG